MFVYKRSNVLVNGRVVRKDIENYIYDNIIDYNSIDCDICFDMNYKFMGCSSWFKIVNENCDKEFLFDCSKLDKSLKREIYLSGGLGEINFEGIMILMRNFEGDNSNKRLRNGNISYWYDRNKYLNEIFILNYELRKRGLNILKNEMNFDFLEYRELDMEYMDKRKYFESFIDKIGIDKISNECLLILYGNDILGECECEEEGLLGKELVKRGVLEWKEDEGYEWDCKCNCEFEKLEFLGEGIMGNLEEFNYFLWK